MVPSTGRVDRPSVTLSSARVRAPSSTSLTGSATSAPNSCCQRRTGSSPNPVTDSTVAVGDNRTTLDPATAGLSFDATATVESVTGFGLEPVRLWQQLFGAGVAEPVSEVDEGALTLALESVTEGLSTLPVDGTITYLDGRPQSTAPVDGIALDVDASAALLADSWLTVARPIELPTVVDKPSIGQAQLDRSGDGQPRVGEQGGGGVDVQCDAVNGGGGLRPAVQVGDGPVHRQGRQTLGDALQRQGQGSLVRLAHRLGDARTEQLLPEAHGLQPEPRDGLDGRRRVEGQAGRGRVERGPIVADGDRRVRHGVRAGARAPLAAAVRCGRRRAGERGGRGSPDPGAGERHRGSVDPAGGRDHHLPGRPAAVHRPR